EDKLGAPLSEVAAKLVFFFQAEDGIRDFHVTGVQTCALPICHGANVLDVSAEVEQVVLDAEELGHHHADEVDAVRHGDAGQFLRSEEHTSELQSRENIVCRLMLEKKKHYKPNNLQSEANNSCY